MRKPTLVMAVALLTLVLSCGSSNEEPTAVDAEREAVFAADQTDLDQAVFEQAEARMRWDSAEVGDYTMRVGYQSVGHVEVVVVDGSSVSETVVDGNGTDWPELPRTVPEAFDQLDEMLAAAAANDVAPDGDCAASYFTIRWNQELGYPTYYDGLGPCEDGVGVEITIETAASHS